MGGGLRERLATLTRDPRTRLHLHQEAGAALDEHQKAHAPEALPAEDLGVDDEPLTAAEPTSSASRPLPGPKRLALLLCQGDTGLVAAEGATVARVRQDSELTAVHDAVTAFIGLVRTKTSEGFDAWLQATTTSTIRALRTFACGIQADYAAVIAASRTALKQRPM